MQKTRPGRQRLNGKTRRNRALFALLLLGASVGAARAGGVVSLNLCADDFLLALAPEQITALTVLANDPSLSVQAAAAGAVRRVRADPEAVLALHPDLVLAAPYGAQQTLRVLAGQGVRIGKLRLPEDFSQIRNETRRIASLLGVPRRGEAALADMDRILASLRPGAGQQAGAGQRALFLEPRGWTSGPNDLATAVLRAAGYRPVGDGSAWSLEAVVAARPDLLVLPQAPGFPSLATALLHHPALRGIPVRTVSPALLICGGPWTARAAQQIAPP